MHRVITGTKIRIKHEIDSRVHSDLPLSFPKVLLLNGVTVLEKVDGFLDLATEYSLPATQKNSWTIALRVHRNVLLMQTIFCFPWQF